MYQRVLIQTAEGAACRAGGCGGGGGASWQDVRCPSSAGKQSGDVHKEESEMARGWSGVGGKNRKKGDLISKGNHKNKPSAAHGG